MKNKLVKVCGLRDSSNIRRVFQLKPELAGFIFYPGSKRCITNPRALAWINTLVEKPIIIGVFVNQDITEVLTVNNFLYLDGVQLHGQESPEFCGELKQKGFKILKAFGLNQNFPFDSLARYEETVDWFLFDTPSDQYGGSGRTFNWNLIDNYTGKTPFILSGGIGPDSDNWPTHETFSGIDLNSRFERSPGLKDPIILESFIKRFRNEK